MAKELTKKQELFVAEYLVDLNATRSAISAGYSAKSAESQAAQLLQNPKVSAAISKKHGKRLGKLEITADRVLQEIARLAFFDPRSMFDEKGDPIHIPNLDVDTAMAVAGFEVYQEYEGKGDDRKLVGFTKKFKLADKGQNLERLGRHLKLFTDKNEVSGPGGSPIPVSLEIDL